MLSQRFAACCLALTLVGAAAPGATAQSRTERANELVDRLARDRDMSAGDERQVYARLIKLGPAAHKALVRRWPELSEQRGATAIALISRLNPKLSVPAVTAAARSDNTVIRRAAASSLLDLLEVAPERVLELATELLRDPDESVTISAVDNLAAVGGRDVWRPLLDFTVAEVLNDPETTVRSSRPRVITVALRELSVLMERHADHMMMTDLFSRAAQIKLRSDEGVEGGDPPLPYERLFEIIGQRPSEIALPYLRAILEECYRAKIDARTPPADYEEEEEPVGFTTQDPNLALALEQIFGEEGEGGIAKDLRPWPAEVRLIAVGTVAQLRDPASLPFVLSGMSDPDHRVRRRSLDVVGWVMPEAGVERLECYEEVVPLLVDRHKKLRRKAHRWLQGYTGNKTVGQSFGAWTEWLNKAKRSVEVERYLTQLSREAGFPSLAEMLAANGKSSSLEYLESLGYETEAEFLDDMAAEAAEEDPE